MTEHQRQSRESLEEDFYRVYGKADYGKTCRGCRKLIKVQYQAGQPGMRHLVQYQTCELTTIGRDARYDSQPPEWEEGYDACGRYED